MATLRQTCRLPRSLAEPLPQVVYRRTKKSKKSKTSKKSSIRRVQRVHEHGLGPGLSLGSGQLLAQPAETTVDRAHTPTCPIVDVSLDGAKSAKIARRQSGCPLCVRRVQEFKKSKKSKTTTFHLSSRRNADRLSCTAGMLNNISRLPVLFFH
jgi:hypothetical protein